MKRSSFFTKSTILLYLALLGLSCLAPAIGSFGLSAFAQAENTPTDSYALFLPIVQDSYTQTGTTATPTATGTATTIPPTSTVTPTATPIPQPCNQVATDLIVQLSELTDGFSVREEGPMTLDAQAIALGAVDSYTISYINMGQLLTGTSGVRSDVIVFLTEAGAQSYLAATQATVAADPAFETIDIPAYGDESGAFKSTLVESGVTFTAYTIYVRQNNIGTTVSTAALPGVADLEVTKGLAEVAVGKICTD